MKIEFFCHSLLKENQDDDKKIDSYVFHSFSFPRVIIRDISTDTDIFSNSKAAHFFHSPSPLHFAVDILWSKMSWNFFALFVVAIIVCVCVCQQTYSVIHSFHSYIPVKWNRCDFVVFYICPLCSFNPIKSRLNWKLWALSINNLFPCSLLLNIHTLFVCVTLNFCVLIQSTTVIKTYILQSPISIEFLCCKTKFNVFFPHHLKWKCVMFSAL